MTSLKCNNLSAISSVHHGFFTRKGGVSGGIYQSLNCGLGSGDDRTLVLQNRAVATKELGAANLCIATQTHSNTTRVVTTPWTPDNQPEADALVTTIPGIAVGVLTADCLPVLLCDAELPMVAALHAGWKGAFSGIIESAIDSMTQQGAEKSRIIACIGPAIAQPSYEVGPEFYEQFYDQDMQNDMYFLPANKKGFFLFDLVGYGKNRLADYGIKDINILAYDTCMDEDNFYSFRRATLKGEPAYGRQLSAIAITSPLPQGGEG